MRPEIRVEGLAELRRDLTRAGQMDARGDLRDGLKAAADIVAVKARGNASQFSQRASDSIRATAGGNRAFVVGGRSSLPWYGWADFGSRTPVSGRPRSVGPWAGSGKGPAKGRFIYPAIDSTESAVVAAVARSVSNALAAQRL